MLKTLKTNISISILSLLLLSLFVTIPSYAQSLTDFQILKFNNIEELLKGIVDFLVGLAPVLAGLVIVYGGYQYFLGGFDQKANGMKAIQSAVIGLVLVFGYQIITTLVTGTISGGGFNTQPLVDFVTTINGALVTLSSVFAIAVVIWGGYKYMFSSVPGAKGDGKDAITNGVLGLIAIAISGPLVTLIQGTVKGSTTLDLDTATVQTFILNIINNFLIPISSVVTVVFFIIGGYYMLTSGGNDSQYKKGLDYLKNALIGLIVILVSFTVTQLVIYFVTSLNIGG